MSQLINDFVISLNSIGRGFCNYAGNMFVQSSILIILLLIIDFLLRKRVRAIFRYCIWMLVFIKLVLPPTLSSPTGVGYWFGDFLPAERAISKPISDIFTAESAKLAVPEDFVTGTGVAEIQPTQTFSEDAISETTPVALSLPPVTWQAVVFSIWLVGVLIFSALLIQRIFFVRSLLVQSKPAKGRLLDTLNQSHQLVGIRRNIELKLSSNLQSPAVCGLFKPVILMPASLLEKLSRDKLRAVLIHELVHIKRGDLWVNLAQTLLQIIYFYNPFVWLANVVVRRIREQAVDEAVLVALGTEATGYSNTLIDIAEMVFWKANFALRLIGVAESKRALQRRIKHMLARPIPKSAKLGFLGLIAVVIVGAVLLPMAKADNFTHHANKVMKLAEQEARQLNHEYIGTEHILLALIHGNKGVSATILKNLEVDIENVRLEIGKVVKSGSDTVKKKKLPQTPRAEKAMEYAQEESKLLGHDCVSNEHILLGLLRVRDGVGAQVLKNLGVEYENVRQEVLELVGRGPIKGGHPTLVIIGMVADAATGQPIAGAKVGDDKYAGGLQSTITDSDGTYNYLTWYEEHDIKCEAAGYKTKHKVLYTKLIGSEEEKVIDFALESSGSVKEVDYSSVVVEEGRGFDNIAVGDFNCTGEFIKSQLGEPDKEVKNEKDWWLNYRKTYGLGFWVNPKENLLIEIRLNKGFKGRLASGISMLSTKQDVFRVYGEPIRQEVAEDFDERFDNQVLLFRESSWLRKPRIAKIYYDEHGLLFWFDREKLNQIVVYRPGGAGQCDEGEFIAALPNGVTVKLVGVCEHPGEGKKWWQPDGVLLKEQVYMKKKGSDTDEGCYGFAARVDGPEDLNFSWAGFEGSDGWWGTCDVFDAERGQLEGFEAAVAKMKEGKATTAVRIGIAAGQWRTVAVHDGRSMCMKEGVAFSRAYESDGSVHIVVTDNFGRDVVQRIVAIDTDGNLHIWGGHYGSVSSEEMRQTTGTFANLKLSQIKEFLFQTRPYQWVEFKNVSLRRGLKTDVQVGIDESIDDDIIKSTQSLSLRIYDVNRNVADFPEKEDFSRPDAAYAAINRVSASGDLSGWQRVSVKRLAEQFSGEKGRGKMDVDKEWAKVLLNARILEVWIYDKTQNAMVIAELPQEFTSGTIRKPIDIRHLELENGRWLNTGNDRAWTIEEARVIFKRKLIEGI